MVVLENEELLVEINELGAELKRIYGKKNDVEYLWKGDQGPRFWQRSATILFPFVGRLQDAHYTYCGKEYKIGCHGFAKDSVFDVIDKNDKSVTFELVSNEKTLAEYPFDFKLRITYTLVGMHVAERVVVENTDKKDLLFKVGFHPGFNLPLTKECAFEDYSIVFENATKPLKRGISVRGLDLSTDFDCPEIVGKTMRLNHEIFKDDAIVLSKTEGKAILKSDKSEHGVELTYDAPWCGIWQTYDNETPFVAIEPWYQLPGKDLEYTALEKIEDINKLKTGETAEYKLDFQLF